VWEFILGERLKIIVFSCEICIIKTKEASMAKSSSKYGYKILVTNFKDQHQELYEWMKEYCRKNGVTISHQLRELIKNFKESKESKESKGE
jgi:hypothetical protein